MSYRHQTRDNRRPVLADFVTRDEDPRDMLHAMASMMGPARGSIPINFNPRAAAARERAECDSLLRQG